MWDDDDDDDDFYRFFRNHTPSKFKATKYVTITVSEGDNEGIDKAIKLLESMRSKSSDPVEAAKSDREEPEDKFDKDFTEENL